MKRGLAHRVDLIAKTSSQSTRRWRFIDLAFLLLIIGGVWAVMQMARFYDGPTVDGYSMEYWFYRHCADSSDLKTQEALKQFGAELAPYLILCIQTPDSGFRDLYVRGHRKLHEAFPSLRRHVPLPPTSERIRYQAQKAFRYVTHGARPFIKPQSQDRKDAIVAELIQALECEDLRVIEGRYEKLPSGKLVPLTIRQETVEFSANVLGLMRGDAEVALPHLESLLESGGEEITPSIEVALERIREAVEQESVTE